jgi:hypothetical protein
MVRERKLCDSRFRATVLRMMRLDSAFLRWTHLVLLDSFCTCTAYFCDEACFELHVCQFL